MPSSEVRRLEDEKRKLKYHLAQEKFRKHAMMLKLEGEFQQGVAALEASDSVRGTPSMEPLARKDALNRSPSSDGSLPRFTGSKIPDVSVLSPHRQTRQSGSKGGEGGVARSRQTLPSISQSSAERYISLEPVQEEGPPARAGRLRSRRIDDRGVSRVQEGVVEPGRSRRTESSGNAGNTKKKSLFKSCKPKWEEVCSRDAIDHGDVAKSQGGVADGITQTVDVAQLVESEKDVYPEKVVVPLTKKEKKKKQKRLDGVFTKRRRALNDPRNALSSEKTPKRPVGTLKHDGIVKLMQPDSTVMNPQSVIPSISETPRTSLPHKEEIIAIHKAPNLKVAKKIKIRVRNKLVEPSTANAKREHTTVCPVQSALIGTPCKEETVSKICVGTMKVDETDDGDCVGEEDYEEEFETEFEEACEGLSVSRRVGRGMVHSTDFFVVTNDAEETERSEGSISPSDDGVTGGLSSPTSLVNDVEESDSQEGRRITFPKNESCRMMQTDGSDCRQDKDKPSLSELKSEQNPLGKDTTGCMAFPSESTGGSMGSRSSKRPTSSTRLPFYENTEPLRIIVAAPRSPTSALSPLNGSPMHDYASGLGGLCTPTSAAGRRYSRGLMKTLESIDGEDPRPVEAEATARCASRKSGQTLSLDSSTRRSMERLESVDRVAVAAPLTVRRQPRRLSLPTNTILRKSIDIQESTETFSTDVASVNTDSKQDQISVNRRKTLRQPITKVDEVLASIKGDPTSLDMTILKSSGALKRSIIKDDSFEKFTRHMESKKKSDDSSKL